MNNISADDPLELGLQDFLHQVAEGQKLWTLANEEGFVVIPSEQEDCIPVWSSDDQAKIWAEVELSDNEPLEIPLALWLEKWLPGLQGDQVSVAISPVSGAPCLVMDASDLAGEMAGESDSE